MSEIRYPMRFKSNYGGAVIEFTDLTVGTVIDRGNDPGLYVGYYSTVWLPHTDPCWTPVEMPSTTKAWLHKQIGDYRGL